MRLSVHVPCRLAAEPACAQRPFPGGPAPRRAPAAGATRPLGTILAASGGIRARLVSINPGRRANCLRGTILGCSSRARHVVAAAGVPWARRDLALFGYASVAGPLTRQGEATSTTVGAWIADGCVDGIGGGTESGAGRAVRSAARHARWRLVSYRINRAP
jgi:hypothetical protein